MNNPPPRRQGKSNAVAFAMAAAIKSGKKVGLAYTDRETGELRIDPVVTVPGYDDGTQLADHSRHRRRQRARRMLAERDEGEVK